MSREIIVKKQQPVPGAISRSASGQQEDPYLSKVIKLVPADIISVYLGIFNLIKSNASKDHPGTGLQWIFFGAIALLTPFYLRKVAGVKSIKQIIVCEVSFLIWVLCIGGPLDGTLIAQQYTPQFIGALIVPLYTLLIPLITFPDPKDNTNPTN